MGTVSIRLDPLGKEITAERGSSLMDILHEFGVEFPCGGKGSCGKCKLKILQGEIVPDSLHLKRLEELELSGEWRLACMSRAECDLILEVGQFEVLIQADQTTFDFKASKGYGVAVDLGTTSLVAQLLELSSAKVLALETALNPQRRYGSDLISRLEHALSHGNEMLTSMIRKEVGDMLSNLLKDRNISLDRVVLVGNTVMQHFFAGSDTESLSYYPFESPDLGRREFTAADLDWNFHCERICFYPSIGSFVGSDILAGIHATGMWRKKEYSVLVDLGTNGEIVVGNRDGLLCASTAAGPAFEGATISMGMLATTGAISSVEQGPDGISCSVIGNVPAAGICGSGLIDAVAVMLESGQLGGFGEILSGQQELSLTKEVVLIQKDIQEFQLAKAAISAGVLILMKKLGIDHSQVDDVYISGGFGNYINLENVIRTGMLNFPQEKIHQMGNSALMGAKMFLYREMYDPAEILSIVEHISLESVSDFQDVFIDQLAMNLIV